MYRLDGSSLFAIHHSLSRVRHETVSRIIEEGAGAVVRMAEAGLLLRVVEALQEE